MSGFSNRVDRTARLSELNEKLSQFDSIHLLFKSGAFWWGSMVKGENSQMPCTPDSLRESDALLPLRLCPAICIGEKAGSTKRTELPPSASALAI